MPKYRAQLGGIEGSGQYMSPSGAVDFGGIVQALGTTATSLIQGAYARKLAQKNAAAAAAQLERTNQFKERELTGQEEERKARRLDIDAQRATRLAEIQQRRQDAIDKEARDRAADREKEERDRGEKVRDRESRERTAATRLRTQQNLTPAQVAAQEARRVTTESKLRSDFEGNPLVKNAYGVANAIGASKAALSQEGPVGDLMALYAMVKLFDPNSVVREGEITLSQSANSLPDKLKVMYENTVRGRKITPQYRKQMESMIDEMVGQNERLIAPVQRRFGESARRSGADSSAVAPSPFEGMRSADGPKGTLDLDALIKGARKRP